MNDKTLVETAYDIIADEKLPKPSSIKIRRSLMGTKRKAGTCLFRKSTKEYKIIIHGTTAKYVKCENGNLIHKKTKEKYKRVLGEELPIQQVIHTIAHEIAHLRFWNHDEDHKNYTEYIYELICKRLGK